MSRPVLLASEVVPFFINVECDHQRLFEVVQVRMDDVHPDEIADQIVSDIGMVQGFREQIQSLVEAQYLDYRKLLEQVPATEWARQGSAVHLFTLKVGIDSVVYDDMIEWDIFDASANPDEFALLTVKELGLPVEFVNVISGQIRYQVLRLRAMHCHPEQFQRFIEVNVDSAPQTVRGLRQRADLLNFTPGVGLVPGFADKKTRLSRERNARHWKRMGAPQVGEALQSSEDLGEVQVKLVPIVRAAPMPEDSISVDLAVVPKMLGDDRFENEEVVQKVRKKFDSVVMMAQRQNDDSDSDSGDR